MAIQNRYDTKCSNPACPEKRNRWGGLPSGMGFAVKKDGRWHAYCNSCTPERIESSGPPVRKLTADGKIICPYESQNLPLLRAMPGAKWNPGEKCWNVSVSVQDIPRTIEIAEKLKLEIPPALRLIAKPTEQAIAVDSRLYPFQIKGVDHLSRRKRAFLADQMGLGKTVQALAALSQDASWSVLVICPNSLKYNWRNESKKWAPKYKVTVLLSKHDFRFPNKGEICIAHYDMLPAELQSTKEKPATVQSPNGLTLIIDEAQYVKNWKAARSSKVKTLSTGAERVFSLTGTPLANRPFDLWGVMCNTDCAKEVFSFGKFLQLFGAMKDRWGGYTFQTPSLELAERLRRVMLRRLREEVMPDLPSKVYTTIECNGISGELQKRLDAVWEEWGDVLQADELPPFEEFSAIRAMLAKERIPAMIEQIDFYEEEGIPLVVFSAHRAPIDVLGGRAGWKVITGDTPIKTRQEIVDEFQAGKLKGIGLTIAAGGTGITLTYSSHMLFCDLSWVPSDNAQAEDRICRIGQIASSCQIIRLVSDHVLDKHVLNLLVSKAAMAYAAVDTKTIINVPIVKTIIKGETQEQFEIRMAVLKAQEIQAESERQLKIKEVAKGKIARIHSGQMAHKKRNLKPITPELADEIRKAFQFMLGVCDGAVLKDGCGWNKPDAMIAHYILTAGLETQEELEAGYAMCTRYFRQLSGNFPKLF